MNPLLKSKWHKAKTLLPLICMENIFSITGTKRKITSITLLHTKWHITPKITLTYRREGMRWNTHHLYKCSFEVGAMLCYCSYWKTPKDSDLPLAWLLQNSHWLQLLLSISCPQVKTHVDSFWLLKIGSKVDL